jgi:hypothetical protein
LPPSLCTPSPSCHPSMNPADCWKCCNSGLSAFFISHLFRQSLIDKKEYKLYS